MFFKFLVRVSIKNTDANDTKIFTSNFLKASKGHNGLRNPNKNQNILKRQFI